jgi:hypothetical protein
MPLDVPEFVFSLAVSVVEAQHEIDTQFTADLAEYLPVVSAARTAGLHSLAEALLPSRLTLSDTCIDASLTIRKERAASFELSVRPVNVAVHRRYAVSSYSSCRIEVSVRQAPPVPGGRA